MIVEFHKVGLSLAPNKPILKDINLKIASGSFHFLTGASGAGKSSLLKLIYEAQKPTMGKITLFGEDVSRLSSQERPSLRRRFGVVFQDFRLIPHLTAMENTALPLRLAGATEAQIRQHVEELLSWVGLSDKTNAYPHELSGGEQQRIAIARAVVSKPALLLADEPTGNVDETAAAKLLHLFLELNKMGTAIILATHQQNWVSRLNKPILKLENGYVLPSLAEAA